MPAVPNIPDPPRTRMKDTATSSRYEGFRGKSANRRFESRKEMRMIAKIKTLFVDGYNNISNTVILMVAVSMVVLITIVPARSEGLANKYCPVTTSELAEEQFFVDYQGQLIYFCCNNCKRDFLGSPETYLANPVTSGADSLTSGSSHDQGDGNAHNHARDHGESSTAVSILGKFHPMVTHFPIALVISALLFSGLAVVLKIQTLEVVSVYSVYLAALSGLVTVALGLAAGYSASYPTFLAGYLSTHRLLGITTGVMTFVTAFLGHRQLGTRSAGRAWTYRGCLLVNSVLVGITGHFGATLVFGPEHFDF